MNFSLILSKDTLSHLESKQGLVAGDKVPFSFSFSTGKYGPMKLSGYFIRQHDYDKEYSYVKIHVYSFLFNRYSYLVVVLLLIGLAVFTNIFVSIIVGVILVSVLALLYMEISFSAKIGVRRMLNSNQKE